jgi:HAD superfamily hydrolase (TIGR01509 family)
MKRAVAVILDVDGTLVDSVYQHALAWYRAFRSEGIVLPVWRIHRHIGMGGDQLIPAVASRELADARGDALRRAEGEAYRALIEEVQPLEGAAELLRDLKRRGHAVVLSSSAKQAELDHYLDLLEARDVVDAWTSSADVDRTKPQPDLVHVALERAGRGPAVMIGDSVWDCEAARRAGIPSIGLLTGGFSGSELREAGAQTVFDSLPALRDGLDGVLDAVLRGGSAPVASGDVEVATSDASRGRH